MLDRGGGMTLVSAADLAVGYGGRVVLDGVTFTVDPGQRLGVLGPNGGGKSTLLRALLGELTPLAGLLELSARCSVVPQTERSRLDYPVTRSTSLSWGRSRGSRGGAARDGANAAAHSTRSARSGSRVSRAGLRRALGRSAAARAGRTRARSGRRPRAPRRAVHGCRRGQRRRALERSSTGWRPRGGGC